MAKNIVTLYIDDTSVKLLVMSGKRVTKWADSPLEPGLVKNGVVVEEAEVATIIKRLFQVVKVKTKKVIVGVSGLHCLSRSVTLPQLPKEMLDEAVKREATRVLPVPLEQLYLSWQSIPASKGEIQVFLVAMPRESTDALLKVLHQVGLEPDVMDIKPLLLAEMLKDATAIIVDVQPTEFDIVTMADGIPQFIRTVSFLSEVQSWQEKLPMIKDELDRIIEFYNSNNPEKPLTSTTPIFISGKAINELEPRESLSDKLEHPVSQLPSPLECPEGLDQNRYMANIGLAFKKLSSGKEVGSLVVNLNALPTPYLHKPVSLARIVTVPSVIIAIGLCVFLTMLIQGAAVDIASIRGQLATTDQLLQQKLTQRQKLMGSITELEVKITEVEASRDSFAGALSILEEQRNQINRDLEVTIKSLPNTTALSGISHVNSILTIKGQAPNEKQVLNYLEQLDASGRFGEITITNMSRIEGEGIDFTLLGNPQTEGNGVSSIQIALSSLPTSISVTSVSSTNGTFTINGRAPDEDKVLLYVRDLKASGEFSEITISTMNKTEDEDMDFSLVLKIGE